MTEMAIRTLHPSLGAEVSGIDLAAPVDAATRVALSRALAEHLALVFHDQDLTPEQYLAASEIFGTADAAALLAAQHAGFSRHRPGMASQRPAPCRTLAHRSYQP